MATLKQIQFKRSKTAGARPAASVLAEGELAINLKDRTIFTKDDSGNIIDLSISAGGNISGNIAQTGDYLQNGTYNLNGNQFVYAGKYIEFLPKTAGNGAFANQHLNKAPIFTDLSSTTSTSEYHPLIKQRYKDGTFSVGTLVSEGSFRVHYIDSTAPNNSKHWVFNRNGNFIVESGSIEVRAGNISASGNINSATGFVSAPQINTKTIVFDTKAFGQYDSQSLVQYVYPGTGETNGINYLRKVRAKSGGTIYHEIASAQTGKNDEISWWTGNTLTTKLMGLRNDGAMVLRRSLAIGTITADENTNNYGSPTPMGERYIALGDAATGLKYIKQGVYDLVGNWNSVASITPDSFRSTRKGIFGRSEDQGATWIMPGTNVALLSVQTQADNNNAGDGQTHIGYNSGGKMNHYFRGTGQMNINTQQGMEINPGILKLVTGSNNVQFYADGTISSIQPVKLDNELFLNNSNNTAGLKFGAPSKVDGSRTIQWNAGTRPGQNKNYVTMKAWGNAFDSTAGNRETVFELYDGQGYHFYSQRLAPTGSETVGALQFRISGALRVGGGIISAGSITTESSLVANNGLSVNGQAKFGGTANALRIWNAEYGAIFRRSETALHIIPTLKDQGENGEIGNLRPLSIALHNGMVQMRHSVTLGDDGRGGNMITVDNDSKLVVVTSNARLSPNFRMQIGQSSYIDAECTNSVRPAGAGSFASQNNENVRAPFYMNIDRTDTSTYVPILKQRYVQGNGCYSLGTLINNGNFRVHYHGGGDNGSTGPQTADFGWEFIKNGDFISPRDLIAGKVRFDRTGNITGGSGNFANLDTTLNCKVDTRMVSYSGTGGWYKLATVTMPQSTSTIKFEISGGNGYNVSTPHQCVISQIVLRTSNNNPKGINAVVWSLDVAQGIKNVATVNTSGDVYDIYVNVGAYAQALAVSYYATPNANVNQIFASNLSGATETAVELPETAIQGQVASILNNLQKTPNGPKRYVAESEIAINNQTGLRITSNSDRSGSNSVLFRNDGGNFYILLTDKNSSDGDNKATEGDWNGKRPFSIDMTAGTVRLGENTSFDKDVTINGNINSRVKVAGQWNVSFSSISDVTRDNSAFLANTGGIPKTSQAYYPLFSGYSFLTDAGYRQSFEFGWLGVSGTWRQGIIRMRGDNTSGQQARWTFDMDGTFYAPILSCGSARAFGVNTSNGLGGNSITFGDNDTGIKQNGDGLLDIYANGVQTFRFQNGDLYSYKNINAPNVYIRSDIRLKSNFKPIENALDKVEKLNGVIYDKAEYIGGDAIETEAGIVAQTLQDVLPEAVRETEDSKGNKILTVSSQAQIALLVEAVKTLSARVKELESKLM